MERRGPLSSIPLGYLAISVATETDTQAGVTLSSPDWVCGNCGQKLGWTGLGCPATLHELHHNCVFSMARSPVDPSCPAAEALEGEGRRSHSQLRFGTWRLINACQLPSSHLLLKSPSTLFSNRGWRWVWDAPHRLTECGKVRVHRFLLND